MDFFATETLQPSEQRLAALRNVGRLVSQAIERIEKDTADREAAAELAHKVDLVLEVVRAAADGDLTRTIPVAGDDAIGQLAGGLETLLENLRASMRDIGSTADTLTVASDQLTVLSQGMGDGATLTIGGSFDAMATAWGLTAEDGDDAHWRGVDVGLPFQHAKAGILYVAAHLPPPGRDGTGSAEQLSEIAGLITAADGRTLGLFSSMRAARAAAEAMRERLSTPVLCQGDDGTSALVEQFSVDPQTSLFGTLSLWQGVDVPGPSLSLVLIDRIPFPRPDDPLLGARQRAVAARGGNGFMAVAANHAALLLAQGSGRLLRRVTDRGVVAVLDSRMVTAGYGGYLRASLPPFWQTTNGEQVRQALQRLRTATPSEEGLSA